MTGKQPVILKSGRLLDFSGPALVMAIVNCNDDSFYAPSRALFEEAAEKALAAEEDGASIIDFGAESSRPGSSYINEETELKFLIPVITAFRKRSSLPVSVDTRKSGVARAAMEAGADIINDISALRDDPDMAQVCAEYGAAIVLMHMKGIPLTMQESGESYTNLFAELKVFFNDAVNRALEAGIARDKIILDPGIGFGKNYENNIEIMRRMRELASMRELAGLRGSLNLAETPGNDYPLLIGLSRKKFIGEMTGNGDAAERRLAGTLAANGAAIMGGADIIRVHDVKEHVDLAKVLFALHGGKAHL